MSGHSTLRKKNQSLLLFPGILQGKALLPLSRMVPSCLSCHGIPAFYELEIITSHNFFVVQ